VSESLHAQMSVDQIEEALARLSNKMTEAYGHYKEQSLSVVYEEVKSKLEGLERREQIRISTARTRLSRQFGVPEVIRATALGNVVESYRVYPYSRYRMEAGVFWPRLQLVIEPKFLATIRESQILFDFCLTMITVGCLFGLITALVGPWLWSNWELWGILTMAAFLISYIFYRVALVAADQFGELVCSSFDLFRLDLLTALRQHDPEISRLHNGPLTIPVERQKWRQLNRLLNFGDSN
jgi:hypothetical protein